MFSLSEDTSGILPSPFRSRDSEPVLWVSELDSRITWPQSLDPSSPISTPSYIPTPTCATGTIDIHRGLITLPSHRYDASTQSWELPTLPIRPGQTRELVHQSRSRSDTSPPGSVEWKYLGRYECVWEELVGMEELEGLCDKVSNVSFIACVLC